MLEVETKYELADKDDLIKRLDEMGAVGGNVERHADTYYRHPSRDFVQTKEAFRIRMIDSVASVTYKGPKMDVGDSALKAREEIEWCLAPGDADGSQMTRLLQALGFDPVATVRKERRSYAWPTTDTQHTDFTLTIDQVDQVGLFAEIELLLQDDSPDAVKSAGERIDALAGRLGLVTTVRSSYLNLLLAKLRLDR
ncbi:CYTH domain protein [Stieleria neptunia]|uniref:CYTH domain protein n=1 Tax=Stieleria neptunia TaxID=2527979 RepID=A0A518I083_9BACT|nr:class IV adenylate cyclase [Stieleria neptunia]QDV46492.1 CYTH domain protein [Stieleria neptunia]